jgi:type IV pilus assembly protein PilA
MVEGLKLKAREQKGFTLIELLAVIVILGILAAIAIPAIGNVISDSKEKAKVSEGLQVVEAAKLYVVDNSALFTPTVIDAAADDKVLITAASLLGSTLDRVKDSTFTVEVSYDGNKHVYTLNAHESAKVTGTGTTSDEVVTEQELATFINNN